MNPAVMTVDNRGGKKIQRKFPKSELLVDKKHPTVQSSSGGTG